DLLRLALVHPLVDEILDPSGSPFIGGDEHFIAPVGVAVTAAAIGRAASVPESRLFIVHDFAVAVMPRLAEVNRGLAASTVLDVILRLGERDLTGITTLLRPDRFACNPKLGNDLVDLVD